MQIVMKEYNLESFKQKDIYTWDEIISTIEDLESQIMKLKEILENIEQDVNENYRRIPVNEQYEVYDRDFI